MLAISGSVLVAFLIQSVDPISTQGDWSWDSVRSLDIRTNAAGRRYVADELLIGLERVSDRTRCIEALDALDVEVIGEIAPLNVLRVRLPAAQDPLAVAALFDALPGVAYAEPNDVGEGGAMGTPDDTHFEQQWHLDNTGQFGGTIGADIAALGAWSLVHHAEPVRLAILDSGIDFAHPEFLGRTLPGHDFVNEDGDPSDDHSHGVLCAGLAAATSGNGFGVAGVDSNCTILPVKVLNAVNGGTVMDLARGLNYCAAERADVVSMSLINYPLNATLRNALKRARGAGCILVACAGNGGIGNADISGPGASPLTISIGATNLLDIRASYSGTGGFLDFVAPGDGVLTVSFFHDDSAWWFGGCSAATPVVAGIVSMLKGFDRGLTHERAFELLKIGAEDEVGPPSEDTPGRDNFFGWGRVNAWRTVAASFHGPHATVYGSGKPTSLETQPAITTRGTPRLSWNDFALDVEGAVPGELVFVFHGTTPAEMAWNGGLLLVGGPRTALRARPLDADGAASFAIPITSSMTGARRFYQAWFRDPNHPDGTGIGITNAVEVMFGP